MMKTLTGLVVLAAALAPACARADGNIVIELKGAPQPPPAVTSEPPAADGSTGYVPTTYVQLLNYRVTDAEFGPAASGSFPQPPANASRTARAILERAYQLLGTPYVWGGNDERGIDCSGLVKYCFGACGI